MKTSYFGNPKLKIIKDEYLVSIAMRPPKFRNIRIYRPLCPSWNLVSNYKEGKISERQYIIRYFEENLNKLDRQKTFDEIGEDSILLCYEKPNDFCHRKLVAMWLNKLENINVIEL